MKKFFLSVQTFNSTTELGKIVARKVYVRYHHSLILEEQIKYVADFVNETMNKAIRQNCRLKPMKVTLWRQPDAFRISLRPDTAGSYEKYAFNITGTAVFNDFTGNKEGGEA